MAFLVTFPAIGIAVILFQIITIVVEKGATASHAATVTVVIAFLTQENLVTAGVVLVPDLSSAVVASGHPVVVAVAAHRCAVKIVVIVLVQGGVAVFAVDLIFHIFTSIFVKSLNKTHGVSRGFIVIVYIWWVFGLRFPFPY